MRPFPVSRLPQRTRAHQAALERLAYFYVVQVTKSLAAKDFKKLKTSDQLRLLFSQLQIPVASPESLLEAFISHSAHKNRRYLWLLGRKTCLSSSFFKSNWLAEFLT